jgi:serine-type D-Ala-D-Ala endopeptidase (penicillin-binding protein 7)
MCLGLTVDTASAQSATASQATPKKTTTKKTITRKSTTSRASTSSARRSRTRSRAATQARLLREAQEPRFRLDDSGALVPDVRAEAAIIYDSATGHVLWESNSQNQRSIASITKVMTAVVFMEDSPNLSDEIVVQASDVRAASTTYIRAGYRITKGDLLHLTLIASDNAAARALARVSSLGSEAFIARMNSKAAELGLTNTSYADPSGLLSANVSSAYDMAKLITYVSGDERIASVMRTQTYTVTAGRRVINIHSTNQLVMNGDVDVQAGKTGFISKSGYCLATLLRLPQGGPEVAVVVLGAKSNAGRFWETRHLFNWFASKAEDLLGTPLQAATASATAN